MIESIVESLFGNTLAKLVSAAFCTYAVTLVIMLFILSPGLGWQYSGKDNVALPAGWLPLVAFALLLYNLGVINCLMAAK